MSFEIEVPLQLEWLTSGDIERIAAIGNQASFSLTRLGVPHEKVRHPSQGGKNKFVAGMARHARFPSRR